MRDDPRESTVTYARAAEILSVPIGTVRVWVHRGKFSHPLAGIGHLLEIEVLEMDRTRRQRTS